MKRFFKKIIRKIGYKFIRILVPCVIALSLILSCGISANALQYNAGSVVFDIDYADYWSNGVNNVVESQIFETDSGFYTKISNSYTGVVWSRVRFNFTNNTLTNGTLKVKINATGTPNNSGAYSGAYLCYNNGGGNGDIFAYFEIVDGHYELNYSGQFPQSFYIMSHYDFETIAGEYRTAYYDISFTAIHTGADDTNYNLYENVESELLESQKNYLKDGADFISGLQGMPTQGMYNGLAVISQFMTRFLTIGEFGSIFRISLALGFFAFIVGMGVFIGTNTEFGYRGKHSKGESKGGKHSK